MTIEEALVQLERLKKCEVYLWSEDKQAIDMAVKALEENDTLKTEIMAVKSGSDVLKIRKLEEETAELKRMLKLAVEDIERFRCLMSSTANKDFCETALEYHCNPYDLCNSCPLSGSAKCKWRYADEAMKLNEGEKNG